MTESAFIEINHTEIQGNPFKMIDQEWFLLTAGTLQEFNTMTASWGGLGILWNKPVVFAFVRPQRFTYGFMESGDLFTLSFLDEIHRDKLNFCGKYSGRDVNKIVSTGLEPTETSDGSVYFKQARLVFQCRKIYFDDIDPSNFLIPAIQKNYPKHDYHRMYIGEIVKCLIRKEK